MDAIKEKVESLKKEISEIEVVDGERTKIEYDAQFAWVSMDMNEESLITFKMGADYALTKVINMLKEG